MASVVSSESCFRANILGFIKDFAAHLSEADKRQDAVQNFIDFSVSWLQSEVEGAPGNFQIKGKSSLCDLVFKNLPHFFLIEFLSKNGYRVSCNSKDSEDITKIDKTNHRVSSRKTTGENHPLNQNPDSKLLRENLFQYICQRPNCGQTFTSKESLLAHLYEFENETICPVCFVVCPKGHEGPFQVS